MNPTCAFIPSAVRPVNAFRQQVRGVLDRIQAPKLTLEVRLHEQAKKAGSLRFWKPEGVRNQ
jgi:hypothetical protein